MVLWWLQNVKKSLVTFFVVAVEFPIYIILTYKVLKHSICRYFIFLLQKHHQIVIFAIYLHSFSVDFWGVRGRVSCVLCSDVLDCFW